RAVGIEVGVAGLRDLQMLAEDIVDERGVASPGAELDQDLFQAKQVALEALDIFLLVANGLLRLQNTEVGQTERLSARAAAAAPRSAAGVCNGRNVAEAAAANPLKA